MSSRKIEDCSVQFAATLAEFELQLQGAALPFVRACTYRSAEEQNELYAMGRTKPGMRVTNLKGGQSLHNDAIDGQPAANAADYYPLIHGKLAGDQTDVELALWTKMGQIATACGMEWGGNFKPPLIDRPHVQMNRAQYLEWCAATQKG
jgi:peptidoglycan L-alanyl-D-glutamate endopeptidase CwlK